MLLQLVQMFGPGAVAESCTLLQLVLSAASKIGLARNLHSGSDWSAASSSGTEELCARRMHIEGESRSSVI